MKSIYDLIVIGTGSMGAAACYYAAKKGLNVLGIDQFEPPHKQGSHNGQSRLIRQAYFEDQNYVPLLQRSYELWDHLENFAAENIFHRTGLLYIGHSNEQIISGVKKSAEEYSLKIEKLGKEQVERRFPAFQVSDQDESIFEENAGYLEADRSIILLHKLAKERGANFIYNQKVISWELRKEYIVVFTKENSFRTKKLIVSTGAFAQNLIPRLRNTLSITKQHIYWLMPSQTSSFEKDKFPSWIIEDAEYTGIFYGFPFEKKSTSRDSWGLKVAHHFPAEKVSPDSILDQSDREADPRAEEKIREIIGKYIPYALSKTMLQTTCFYSNTPDEHFILDYLPGTEQRVIIATGFSGHGFKFVPVIGELLVKLAMEIKPDLDIGFLGIDRFDNAEQ